MTKFYQLTPIEFIGNTPAPSRGNWWIFKCDCGNKTIKNLRDVKNGHTKSCGCLWNRKKYKIFNYSYKFSNSRFYHIWYDMLRRCSNPKSPNFKYYGAKKIKVSMEWGNFDNFFNDMYKSYLEHSKQFGEKNTTIERKNTNGHYNKENCCWATHIEQTKNRILLS